MSPRTGLAVPMAAALALLMTIIGLPGPAQAADTNSQAVVPLPDFPNIVTVGDQNVTAVLRLINNSVGFGPLTLSNIRLNPACGDQSGGCAQPDRGVITLSPTGSGRVGTACEGQTFVISGPDANDQYTFTPGVPVMLQPPDAIPQIGPDTCFIDYTFNVVKAPTIDAGPASPGLQTAHLALVDSTGTTTGAPIETRTVLNNSGTSVSTVLLAPPIITTAATSAVLSQTISDTATVTGLTTAPTPTGSVTFTLFGPDDATCALGSIFTSSVALGPTLATTASPANDAAATSTSFLPTAPGGYQWVAVYSGDANYLPVTSPCGAPNETSTVTRPVASITTTATDVTIGGTISDTATVSTLTAGAPQPTGTVTFNLYADVDCAGTPIFTSTNTLINGVYTSDAFLAPNAGSFIWVATYNGDGIYAPVENACGEVDEVSAVLASEIAITTQAPPTVRLGASLTDTATLSGGTTGPTAPTGTITFNLFGPGDTTCTQLPVFTSIVPVNGNGDYTSEPFPSAGIGTYRWQASYDGDLNNLPAGPGLCGEPSETTQVVPLPTIDIVKDATPTTRLEPGGTFTYNLVVTNTSAETLTITSLVDDTDTSIATDAPVDLNGVGTCAIGAVLGPDPDGAGPALGGVYTCSFDREFIGGPGDTRNDRVTVIGVADDQTPATDNDDATVAITNVLPDILVEKSVTPDTLPEPGGTFPYTVKVTNTSIEDLTITSLVDDTDTSTTTDVPVDLSGLGTCTTAIGTVLPANGGSYTCTFPRDFLGLAGDTRTDEVTATAVDVSGDTATDSDVATVTLTNVAPTVNVDKTATPLEMNEPGGTFTFKVVVTNTSFEVVTITSLTDSVYGTPGTQDISTKGTCITAIGTVLAPDPDGPGPQLGGQYTCEFPGDFIGDAGASQIDVVGVVVVDNTQVPASDTDDATVTLTDVKPTVAVDKVADPTTKVAPGGTFTFKVKVTNTSVEAVTIKTLTDDVYGNIATMGTCTSAVGTVLQPQESYSCSFTGDFKGDAGQAQTDIVKVTATDNENNTATATDDATVKLTPPGAVAEQQTLRPVVREVAVVRTLPRTGSGSARLATVAAALIALGGLLVAGSRLTSAGGLLAGGPGISGLRSRRRA
ncbi:MAG: hypothetical protein ABIS47_13985 [Acidimicrobiales bacterium]